MKPIRYPVANPFLGEQEKKNLYECIQSHWISSSGKYIENFEQTFAKEFGPGHCVAVCNGTIAIDLALEAVGISPGDEVLVPNFTFVGSISPIYRLQAIPVLIPTEEKSWNIDVQALKNRLTPKTKAIIAVHLYGLPSNIEAIVAFSEEHGLKVIEDCAEALGAKVNGKNVGTFGDVATYSFFGNKVLTTGEGGMCLCKTKELSDSIRLYRDHGMKQTERYWHRVIGYNGRMTNMQAAVGCGQMEQIQSMIQRRKDIHKEYAIYFQTTDFFHPIEIPEGVSPVNWLESPVLKSQCKLNRDDLMLQLRNRGIDSRPFFFPASRMPAYSRFGNNDSNSDFYSSHGLNLPTYTNLKNEDIAFIANQVIDILETQYDPKSQITIPLNLPENNEVHFQPDVSIILPTYNEENNAVKIVEALRHQMVSVAKGYEIIVMDDQSQDQTVQEIEERFISDPKIKVIVRKGPRGLAESIYEGIRLSKGEYILVMDSDFNHDPEVTGKMVKFAEHFDVVSGSRFTTGGGMQNRLRWFCSLIFNLWIRLLLVLPTQDNLAGFFCIRKKKLNELHPDWIFKNYGDYFFRLLYLAHQKKYSILEIPVWYKDREYGVSKTPFIKTLIRYTIESFKLRFSSPPKP